MWSRLFAGLVLCLLALTLAACGGDGNGTAETPGAAGREVFISTGCGSCHTLEAAGSTGNIGPNLDERLVADAGSSDSLESFVRQSIVVPDAEIADGYQAGVMPSGYDGQLSDDELDDLVAFIVDSVQ
jgi:mono/diheme cytochrome c family protein